MSLFTPGKQFVKIVLASGETVYQPVVNCTCGTATDNAKLVKPPQAVAAGSAAAASEVAAHRDRLAPPTPRAKVTNRDDEERETLFDEDEDDLQDNAFFEVNQPSPQKSAEMLANPPHGKPLTPAQKRYFGMLSHPSNNVRNQAMLQDLIANYSNRWNYERRASYAEADSSIFAGPDGTFPVLNQLDAEQATTLVCNLLPPGRDQDYLLGNIARICVNKGLEMPDPDQIQVQKPQSRSEPMGGPQWHNSDTYGSVAAKRTLQALPRGSRTASSPRARMAFAAAAQALKSGRGESHHQAAAIHEALADECELMGDRAGCLGHQRAAAAHRMAGERASVQPGLSANSAVDAPPSWGGVEHSGITDNQGGPSSRLLKRLATFNASPNVHSFDAIDGDNVLGGTIWSGSSGSNEGGNNPDEVPSPEVSSPILEPRALLEKLLGAAAAQHSFDRSDPTPGGIGYTPGYEFGQSYGDQGVEPSPSVGYRSTDRSNRQNRFESNQRQPVLNQGRPLSGWAGYANGLEGLVMNESYDTRRHRLNSDGTVDVSNNDPFIQASYHKTDIIANSAREGWRGMQPTHNGQTRDAAADFIDGGWGGESGWYLRNQQEQCSNLPASTQAKLKKLFSQNRGY